MEKCEVCKERTVMGGAGVAAKDARKLVLCGRCYRKPGVAAERRKALGLDGRHDPKPKPKARSRSRRKPNEPDHYQGFENLVRAIARDELRRLLEAVIDGK